MGKTISYETIEQLAKELKANSNTNSNYFNPIDSMGMPVKVSSHIQDLEPKLKWSDNLNLSAEFRNKANLYLAKRFGFKEPAIYRTQWGLVVGKNMANVLTANCIA